MLTSFALLRRSWSAAVALVSTLVLWQLAGSTTTGSLLVSTPSGMLAYALTHAADIVRSTAYTGLEASVGMLAATLFSLCFGLCAAHWPRVASAIYPWLLGSQVIPFVCLAPMVILVFGPGVSGKIVLSALMAFFPIVTSILTGMREVPQSALELMTMLKASKHMVIRHVFLPYGLPYFFAGLRVAAPFSVIGAIVAEFNGATWGIGKDIFIAAKRLEPELMMFGIICGAGLSALLYGIAVGTERRLGPWYQRRNQ
ncbi:MAG: ABC transporter permease [Pseudomonadota bacterium]|nr:ABC transporter permease [Pseudomonadota bacterium]